MVPRRKNKEMVALTKKRRIRIDKHNAPQFVEKPVSDRAQEYLDKAASDEAERVALAEVAARILAESVAKQEIKEVRIVLPPPARKVVEEPKKRGWLAAFFLGD